MSSLTPLPGGESAAHPRALDTATDRNAIVEQLDRILTSSLFRHSKRCRPLLQYIVLETINGRADSLKERSLGVAVFGRKPTYDTNEDPIVRSSAAEVRKRIAQYYHEPGHPSEIRIELTSGSYIPHFYSPAAQPASMAAGTPLPNVAAEVGTAGLARLPKARIALAGAAVLLAIAGIWALTRPNDPMKAFWAPLTAGEYIILAAGDVTEETAPQGGNASGQATFAQTSQTDTVGFADGLAMARVAGLLGARGNKFEIRRAGSLTLADLRRSPAVLIGEMNNPWTKLLEGEMRFRFNWDTAKGLVWLEDQQHPKQPVWMLEWNTPYSRLKEDRAIITRVVDRRTEHAILVLAGCGRDGTTAAGEFVSEPRYLEALAAQAPREWSRQNFQVVIATDLINGHSGPPRIIATHFW